MTNEAEDQIQEQNVESGELGEEPSDPTADHLAKLKAIVEAALERNADKPVVLNISGLTSYTESLVVLSGNSSRQVRAISGHIVKTLKANGDHPLGVEGGDLAEWILIDANDAIIHVFDPDTRERFDIEGLWSDAPEIKLELEARPGTSDDKAEDKADDQQDDQVPHPAN